ncbi:hypothetical protein I3843_11G109700 [Carya illinoinensis]|uniref:Growth-regulating factor n=1 Tax=Carya illinoinensis TaxID=32201 RepID=A0A8T1P4U9_CARIL|nr:growth-regulating factor 8 [Carya illinoinensis]KAG2680666.1 hypothetical protein I3760_11G108700 [Carya illinoinensis]KAG6636433.1 hypothetical protein CIPAW_11G111100 [Carya illinoinensis]KAG7956135.1 hypothetical protein I3843_11G109700 [Carya illinoinensis]
MAGTRNGLEGSLEEATATGYDVGLGWSSTQTAHPLPGKKMVIGTHHDREPCHEALLSNIAGFSGEGGGGPMFCNTSNQAAFMSDTYDAAVVADVGSGARGAVVPKAPNHSNNTFSFSSSGGGLIAAAENVRVPYTAAQWQDLERKTMPYKYMMASVPVPPPLLLPIPRSPSNLAYSHSNIVNGGSLEMGCSNNSDPEPWRCRRTDGKKWRCSRDVTPDQKYCERHCHKSRPRSRKPVELQAQLNKDNDKNKDASTLYQKPHFLNRTDDHKYPSSPRTMVTATSCEQPWCLEGFMNGEMVSVAGSNREYHRQQMMQTKVGLNKDNTTFCDTSVAYGQGLQNQERLNDQYCNLSFSPKLATLEEALKLGHTQEKSQFNNAWCTTERDNIGHEINKCSFSNEKLQLSSHTLLPVYGGDETRNAIKNAHMAFGTLGSEREKEGDHLKSQWMNSFSWMSTSPPGGPLAEALCLGNASTSAKAASSSHGCSSGTSSSS